METAFQKNLRRLIRTLDLTQQEVADVVGVSNQLVSKWLSGEVKAPRTDKLVLLAEKYGIRQPFDIMNEGGIDYLFEDHRLPAKQLIREPATAPLYGSIAAGVPIEAVPVEDELWVPSRVLTAHPRGFFLRVEGESMNRILPDGCLAFVDPEAEVESGHVAALYINGYAATIKKVLIGSTSVTLCPMSCNPEYKDRLYDRTNPADDTITIIGRVVWRTFDYRDGDL